ncbi:MAG: PAS domain-containing protein, partial [Archangium sp.]
MESPPPSKSDEKVRLSFEQLGALFMQAPAAICVLSGPALVFTLANDQFRRFMGGRDVLGRPLREALPELEGQGFVEQLEQVYRSGEPQSGSEALVRLAPPGGPREEHFF